MEITQEQYEALATLAMKACSTVEERRSIQQFLQAIETANGVVRSSLWVQWQDGQGKPLPMGFSFPERWPPELRRYIERVGAPITRSDVEASIHSVCRSPINILVTKDPGAIVGWTPLDQYFPGAMPSV